MTHASWNNERGRPSGPGHDNERLEYLGDAVLELVVGEYLFKRFPEYDEGQLTQLRAALVNTSTLARLAERLDLGTALSVGKGAAKTGARKLPSLLANAFEAMIGAIFLDQGYRVATRVFLQNIGDLAEWSDANFKGKLQEVAQDRTGTTPTYHVTATGGPGHKREYTADAIVAGEVVGVGRGGTKQAAEQSAARAALQQLARQPKRRTPRPSGAVTAAQPAVRRRATKTATPGRGGEGRPAASAPAPAPAPVPPSAASPQRRRGLLATLRSAAEALVGRVAPAEPNSGEHTPRRELPRGAAGQVAWPPAGRAPAAQRGQRTAKTPAAADKPAARTSRAAADGRARSTPASSKGDTGPRTQRRRPAAAAPVRAAAPRDDAEPATEARKPTRRGRRGGRGRRRDGTAGSTGEANPS